MRLLTAGSLVRVQLGEPNKKRHSFECLFFVKPILTVRDFIDEFRQQFEINSGLSISVDGKIQPHIGLGSTCSIITGLLYGLVEIFDVKISYDKLVNFYLQHSCEEHEGVLTPCFETGVGSWTSLCGNINVIDSDGCIMLNREIEDDYRILIIYPRNIRKIGICAESDLLMISGRKQDLIFKNEKEKIINDIVFNKLDNKEFLKTIMQMQHIGSKTAELKYANKIYDGLIEKCVDFGNNQSVLLHGLSSLGPVYFYLDTCEKIFELQKSYFFQRYDFKSNIHKISSGVKII